MTKEMGPRNDPFGKPPFKKSHREHGSASRDENGQMVVWR